MKIWFKDLDLFGQSQIVHLFKWPIYFEQVVCEWHNTYDYHTQSGILLDEYYLAISLHDQAIFGIYKCKPVNSPLAEPLCFY